MRQTIIAIIAGLLLLIVGVGAGYGLRAATEPLPQLHITTEQLHVTTQTINPNTLNQYCVIESGWRFISSSDANTGYNRTSEFVQCAPTPLPGQEKYQP